MTKKKVFISYSRKDREFVEGLIGSLRKHGLDVWFDKHLKSGADWDDALEEQIRSNDHMVIVLSATSAASDNVKNEMRFALDHGKRIHPILHEPCSVPLSMRRMHYVDFTNIEYEDAVKILVADINGEPMKEGVQLKTFKKKAPWKPIVFGILGAFAIGIGVWQLWPAASETLEPPGTIGTIDDSGWRKIMNSTDPYDYSKYVEDYGDDEQHMEEAVKKLQDLFTDEGAIILKREELSNYFFRSIHKDGAGKYIQNKNTETTSEEWPERGDLLIAQRQMMVLDPTTQDVFARVMIMPGDFVQFLEVMNDSPANAMIRFYFDKEVIPLDPNWDKRIYKSKYDRTKIPEAMTENEVWKMVSNDKDDLFEGLLYYLERYGRNGINTPFALQLFMEQFDKFGYVMYEDLKSSDGPFFKPYIVPELSGNELRMKAGMVDRTPQFVDIVIGVRDKVSPIYKGIHYIHDDTSLTGDSLDKDQMAIIAADDLSGNQLKFGGNLWFKIKYRDYD